MFPKTRYINITAIVILLLLFHMGLSRIYTGTMYTQKLKAKTTYYVFSENGYLLSSIGMKDMASRLNLLYALYTPVNQNIPSINFDRLSAALNGIKVLDPKNIQPYLTIVYYWSWAKNEHAQAIMAEFLQGGMDIFPENWEIPYAIYRAKKDTEPRVAMQYLQTAAERAISFDGPEWIIDYPAILMDKDGETLEAILWLKLALEKTENPKQIETILKQIEDLEKKLLYGDDYQGEYIYE